MQLTGWKGPGWFRQSVSASGRVTSVLSFSAITSTRSEIAGSSHRRPLANARDLAPPFPQANSHLINPGARVTEIFLSFNREDQVAESVVPAKN